MKERIVVFGTGDIAQLANYYFEIDSNYTVEAFSVDGMFVREDHFEKRSVVPFEEILRYYPPESFKLFVALSYNSMNRLRAWKYEEAKLKGYKLVSYVSSKCNYLSTNKCGDNCLILEDNTIQPFVSIGNNVTLWSGNHIGHHSVIRDHNFISSHVVISGHCVIEPYCFFGVNSTLAHNVHIAEGTLLGAGAIVTKDTQRERVYVPPPSVIIEKKSDQIKL